MINLNTTDTQFHHLERIADAARGDFCKVSKAALSALLRDHVTLLAAATGSAARGGKGHTVSAGPDQKSLTK